jgi:hypothetical protein
LGEAYPGLSDVQIVSAYQRLIDSLALPLGEYLAGDWPLQEDGKKRSIPRALPDPGRG